MNKAYKPKGKILPLLAAMKLEPEREFTSIEAAEIMGCDLRAVGAFTEYAQRAGALFRRKTRRPRGLLLRGTPFPGETAQSQRPINRTKETVGWATRPDDPRIGKVVPGWAPPKMVCVRQEAA